MGEGAALIDIAFEPVSSNRSLRCGETEFSARRQRGRADLGDSRTPVQRQNHARQLRQFGLIAGFREISVRTRMRGGAERTRTACQARSRYRTGLSRVSPPRQFCDRMSRRATQQPGYRAHRSGPRSASQNLLALRKRQCQPGTPPRRRTYPPMRRHLKINRR